PVMTAVERRLGDAGRLRCRGQLQPDRLGRLDVAAVADGGLFALLDLRGGAGERLAGVVVDQLGVNVLGAAEDRQARPFRRAADLVADAEAAAAALGFLRFVGVHRYSLLLSWGKFVTCHLPARSRGKLQTCPTSKGRLQIGPTIQEASCKLAPQFLS